MTLRVNYNNNYRSFHFIECQITDTIGPFLQQIQERRNDDVVVDKDNYFLPAVFHKNIRICTIYYLYFMFINKKFLDF